jgi:hypothetical protein
MWLKNKSSGRQKQTQMGVLEHVMGIHSHLKTAAGTLPQSSCPLKTLARKII